MLCDSDYELEPIRYYFRSKHCCTRAKYYTNKVELYSSFLRNWIFRCKPASLVRLTADLLNIFEKVSCVISSQSRRVKCSSSGEGSNAGVRCGLENLFQGHTSWQTSQPNAQFSNWPFMLAGICSFSSMVKYEMQRLPSTWYGATMACVGQASRQRVQLPQ